LPAGPERAKWRDPLRLPRELDRIRAAMATSNRFLDDLARLMTDAAGAAQGVRREVETVFKSQIERLLQDMNLASREEVDVLRDMVVAAREENEQLALRMKGLEARLEALEGLPSASPPPSA
jgi:BMFP domain-containing protein YqiC